MSPDATTGGSQLDVPPGWDCVPLDQLVVPARGISYGIVQPGKHDPGGVPIVRVTDVRNGRVDTNDVLRVAQDIESAYERTRLQGGEVLLSLVGTLGECAIASDRLRGWNVARAIGVIPVASGTDPQWVALCLRSARVQALMRAWATTTVQATLNLREVRRLPILMPPEWLRVRITETVGALEEKIEQNRQTARALERLARAIFRAWFVDFEPVKAKAAGATTFPSLPQPVFDALPTRFVNSDAGPAPETWQVGPIKRLATLSKTQVHPQDSPEESVDHFSLPAYDAGMRSVVEVGSAIKSSKFLVVAGSVLLSKLNPRIARVWLPPLRTDRRQIASTEFLVFIPLQMSDRHYLYCQFQQTAFREELTQGASGTSNSHQRVRPDDVLNRPVIVPPVPTRMAFAGIANPLFALMSANQDESARLATLRDYLLPKLLSGEVRVEAE